MTILRAPAGAPQTIENGYFVFTLMPSLFCQYNCKHCYLSKEQRADPTTMSLDDFRTACLKIHDFYEEQRPERRVIIAYSYGGEPTSTGVDYFKGYVSVMAEVFRPEFGYEVRHVMLTSLLGVDLDVWAPVWHDLCDGYIQTSYDGEMRSSNYVRKWESKVREAISRGLKVATISVVNSDMLRMGPKSTLEYLADLGVTETGWLPFMLNEQNDVRGKYDVLAPTLSAFNDFMIELLDHWYDMKHRGLDVPEIGEAHFAVDRYRGSAQANMAGQTLFMLPDGEMVLPNYKDGWKEYLYSFGNILNAESSFRDILCSPQRLSYQRRQSTRNGNPECLHCEYKNACLLEFAKPNKPDDECFGAKRFIAHAISRNSVDPLLNDEVALY